LTINEYLQKVREGRGKKGRDRGEGKGGERRERGREGGREGRKKEGGRREGREAFAGSNMPGASGLSQSRALQLSLPQCCCSHLHPHTSVHKSNSTPKWDFWGNGLHISEELALREIISLASHQLCPWEPGFPH
jgi:hypothetical protein